MELLYFVFLFIYFNYFVVSEHDMCLLRHPPVFVLVLQETKYSDKLPGCFLVFSESVCLPQSSLVKYR